MTVGMANATLWTLLFLLGKHKDSYVAFHCFSDFLFNSCYIGLAHVVKQVDWLCEGMGLYAVMTLCFRFSSAWTKTWHQLDPTQGTTPALVAAPHQTAPLTTTQMQSLTPMMMHTAPVKSPVTALSVSSLIVTPGCSFACTPSACLVSKTREHLSRMKRGSQSLVLFAVSRPICQQEIWRIWPATIQSDATLRDAPSTLKIIWFADPASKVTRRRLDATSVPCFFAICANGSTAFWNGTLAILSVSWASQLFVLPRHHSAPCM